MALWTSGWLTSGSAAASAPTPDPFTFAVLADVPYSTREEPIVAEVLRTIASGDDRFVVHLGDVKGPGELCSDELQEIRKTLLDSSPKPLVLLPGGLDWAACPASESGGYDAAERLTRLREEVFSTEHSLGEQTMLLAHQSGVRRFREFAENVRWQAGQVLFVGLNLPAPNNNFRLGGGRNGEFEDRLVANRAWLERAFSYAEVQHLAAIVVLCQADPVMTRSTRMVEGRGTRRDGFFEFKNSLRELAARFRGPVLLVHGAGSESGPAGWVPDLTGKLPKNLGEVRAFASPESQRWIEVVVDTRHPRVFSVAVRRLGQEERGTPNRSR